MDVPVNMEMVVALLASLAALFAGLTNEDVESAAWAICAAVWYGNAQRRKFA